MYMISLILCIKNTWFCNTQFFCCQTRLLTHFMLKSICNYCKNYINLWKIYKFLTQNFRKINDKTSTSEATPLMTAVMGKQFQCIEQLLQSGATLHRQDNSGDSAYHYAVRFEPKCIPVSLNGRS